MAKPKKDKPKMPEEEGFTEPKLPGRVHVKKGKKGGGKYLKGFVK